ncbi:MAG: Clp protease N-terminal domain-containing protein [Solirubrobacteraceae bacterium]
MFERFTESARQVVVNAQSAASEFGHGHIGTEHELLGLLANPETHAWQVLNSLGVTAEIARERVVELVPVGEHHSEGQIPFTPRAKKVLELSLREALSLGHGFITPEHLLLALVRESDGVAMNVLVGLGVSETAIREAVLPLLPGPDPAGAQTTQVKGRSVRGVEFRVAPDERLHRLLMTAAGAALGEGRTEFGVDELLTALAGDKQSGSALVAEAMREAIRRKTEPEEPAG